MEREREIRERETDGERDRWREREMWIESGRTKRWEKTD